MLDPAWRPPHDAWPPRLPLKASSLTLNAGVAAASQPTATAINYHSNLNPGQISFVSNVAGLADVYC